MKYTNIQLHSTLRYFISIVILTLFMSFAFESSASTLKPCPEDSNTKWDSCFGAYSFTDGSEYLGEWREDAPNGNGTYKKPSGFTYVGQFKNGDFDGIGTATWPDGSQYMGHWKNDKFDGKGSFIDANGNLQNGTWTKGSLESSDTNNATLNNKDITNPRDSLPDLPHFQQDTEVNSNVPKAALLKAIKAFQEIDLTFKANNPIILDGNKASGIYAKSQDIQMNIGDIQIFFENLEIEFNEQSRVWDYKVNFPENIKIGLESGTSSSKTSLDSVQLNGSFDEKLLKPTELQFSAKKLSVSEEQNHLNIGEIEVEQIFDNQGNRKSFTQKAYIEDISLFAESSGMKADELEYNSEVTLGETVYDENYWPPFLPNFDLESYIQFYLINTQNSEEEFELRNFRIDSLVESETISIKKMNLSGASELLSDELIRQEISWRINDIDVSEISDLPPIFFTYIPNNIELEIKLERPKQNLSSYLDLTQFNPLEVGLFHDLEIDKLSIDSRKYTIDVNGKIKSDPNSLLGVTGHLEVEITGLNSIITDIQENPSPDNFAIAAFLLMVRGMSDSNDNSSQATNYYKVKFTKTGLIVNDTNLSDLPF